MKNMLAITLLSLGTPMLLMGDEIARSQKGNNNGYCQDNEDFWFNWDNVEKNKALLNFTRELIKHRTKLGLLKIEDTFVDVRRGSLNSLLKKSNIFWHGVKLHHPDWGDDSHSLILEIRHPQSDQTYVFIFNAYWEDLRFELPMSHSGQWELFIDTSLDDGEDIHQDGNAKKYYRQTYTSKARSTVVLRG